MSTKSFIFGAATGAAAWAGGSWYMAQPTDHFAGYQPPEPKTEIVAPAADVGQLIVQRGTAPVAEAPSAVQRLSVSNIPAQTTTPTSVTRQSNVIGRFSGEASFYSQSYDGDPTASGQIYRHGGYTAAHPSLPFGTKLLVTRRDTQEVVYVTVNDRGPYTQGRVLDLSGAAAEALDMMREGTIIVDVEVLKN